MLLTGEHKFLGWDFALIIFYLKAIPWQISDFSVSKYRDALLAVHEKIQAERFVEIESHRFLLIAEKSEIRR